MVESSASIACNWGGLSSSRAIVTESVQFFQLALALKPGMKLALQGLGTAKENDVVRLSAGTAWARVHPTCSLTNNIFGASHCQPQYYVLF